MKIISYNVNGIRAASRKSFVAWLSDNNPDIVCLQELKAKTDQFEVKEFEDLGYHCLWNSAERKGYSGVALLSKKKPQFSKFGIGIEDFDIEGRLIRADIGGLTQISVYIPSGSMGELRQDFKMNFLDAFYEFVRNLKKERPNIIISGDYNICHEAIDIHDPIRNANSSGFLPEEREWFTDFLQLGLIDSFRHFNKDTIKYSWWSYRARAREKNLGWRLDYNIISKELLSKVKNVEILNDAFHSDHCPVVIELDI